jgi:hypothetical protein
VLPLRQKNYGDLLQRQHQVTEVLLNAGFLKSKTADGIGRQPLSANSFKSL